LEYSYELDFLQDIEVVDYYHDNSNSVYIAGYENIDSQINLFKVDFQGNLIWHNSLPIFENYFTIDLDTLNNLMFLGTQDSLDFLVLNSNEVLFSYNKEFPDATALVYIANLAADSINLFYEYNYYEWSPNNSDWELESSDFAIRRVRDGFSVDFQANEIDFNETRNTKIRSHLFDDSFTFLKSFDFPISDNGYAGYSFNRRPAYNNFDIYKHDDCWICQCPKRVYPDFQKGGVATPQALIKCDQDASIESDYYIQLEYQGDYQYNFNKIDAAYKLESNFLYVLNLETFDEDGDNFPLACDCNDNDASINPGANEIPDNQIDENCDDIIEISSSATSLSLEKTKIFPNPTSKYINIEFQANEKMFITLFDLKGNKIYSNLYQGPIDVGNFSDGVYIIKCEMLKNGYSFIDKIILQSK